MDPPKKKEGTVFFSMRGQWAGPLPSKKKKNSVKWFRKKECKSTKRGTPSIAINEYTVKKKNSVKTTTRKCRAQRSLFFSIENWCHLWFDWRLSLKTGKKTQQRSFGNVRRVLKIAPFWNNYHLQNGNPDPLHNFDLNLNKKITINQICWRVSAVGKKQNKWRPSGLTEPKIGGRGTWRQTGTWRLSGTCFFFWFLGRGATS